jgi:hypothetical protein
LRVVTGDEPATVEPATRETKRPGGLAYVVIAALVLSAVVDVWVAIVRFDRGAYVARVLEQGGRIFTSEAAPYDDRVRGAAVAFGLTSLVTAGVFITWFAIVVRHLHTARPEEFRYRSGWAVGGWFIPLFNFVQPKLMVNDAWRAAAGRARRIPKVVHFWWAAFLVGLVLVFAGNGGTNHRPTTLRDFAYGDRFFAVGASILAVAAVLGIVVVVRLDVAANWAKSASEPSPWTMTGLAFNPPPGWPAPPPGWAPKPGWQPDPGWPPAPAGWQFWVAAGPN